MRLVSILIALAMIAYLVSNQLSSDNESVDGISNNENQQINLPQIPTTPDGLPKFEKDMNKFIHDSASKRNKESDEIEGS